MKMNMGQRAHTVGAGGFGKVRMYYSNKFNRKVVEKIVCPNFLRCKEGNRARLTTFINQYSEFEQMLKKETSFLMLMKTANLDCCVEILGFEKKPFKIVMEYCEGGDLRNLLDHYRLPLIDKLYIITRILIAIERIHNLGVIHGDLKCSNILLFWKF